MSDPLRNDGSRAQDGASASDRDAKIEQLLLVGLDHYFAGQYEQAINVWTRALFLDRSHARARAYIDRARSALAEGQRESEELLQNGVAAFHRGDGEEARRLLQAAIDGGAPVTDSRPARRIRHRRHLVDSGGRTVSSTTYIGNPSPAQQYLRITEITYHPAPPLAGSSFSSEDFEYITLKNIGPLALDLTGVHFASGVDFSFAKAGGRKDKPTHPITSLIDLTAI
jgi:tetratricopeptide (TPR) repeat protein